MTFWYMCIHYYCWWNIFNELIYKKNITICLNRSTVATARRLLWKLLYPSLSRSILDPRYIDLVCTIVFKCFGSNKVFLISDISDFWFLIWFKLILISNCFRLQKMGHIQNNIKYIVRFIVDCPGDSVIFYGLPDISIPCTLVESGFTGKM